MRIRFTANQEGLALFLELIYKEHLLLFKEKHQPTLLTFLHFIFYFLKFIQETQLSFIA